MKICYLCNLKCIHPQRSASWFSKQGHEVHVITGQPVKFAGIKIHKINFPRSSIIYHIPLIARIFYFVHKRAAIKEAKQIIEKVKPDIINAYYLSDYGFLASYLGFHPFVITTMGDDMLLHPDRYGKKHIKKMKVALQKADLIHSVSPQITKVLKNLGVSKNNIIYSPEGVDLSSYDSFKIEDFPDEIKKWEKNPLVVSSRHFFPVYNNGLLIKAIPYAIEKNPDLRFVILGDGPMKEECMGLAKKLGIMDYVKFIGRVESKKVPGFFKAARIYVSTSISDSTSVALLEAMASGAFPIVTNIESNRSLIKNGENGFLVPMDNPKILAEKIVYALEKDTLLEKAKLKNYEIAKSLDFNKLKEKLLQKHIQLISRLKN